MSRTLIRNGRIIDPANQIDTTGDLLIRDGKIDRISDRIDAETSETIDATGLIVTPGLVDMHVHLREPGFEHKETIASGTRAAAAGGFTSVACMANTGPVADSADVIELIRSKARKDGATNVFPLGSITKNLDGEELTDVPALLEAGAVGLSDDGKTVMDAGLMRDVLALSAKHNFPVMVHCQEHNLDEGAVMNLGETSHRLNLPGSPNAAEDIIVARDIMLAELTGGHLHVLHVSTAGSVDLVRWGKRKGVNVTAEAMPHHFTLTDEAIEEHGTDAKMHPPLRTQVDLDAVIEGIKDGTLDVIATDHAPHAPFEKAQGMLEAPPGIIGSETCVPLVFDRLIHTGQLSLSDAIARMTCVPAKILQIDRGTLSVGAVADVTLIDSARVATVAVGQSRSKSRNTPFDGCELKGWPLMTIRAGVITHSTKRDT